MLEEIVGTLRNLVVNYKMRKTEYLWDPKGK